MGYLRWLILAAAAGAPLSAQIEWVYPANLGPHPPTKWIAERTCYGEGAMSAEITQVWPIEYFSNSYPKTDKWLRVRSEGKDLFTKQREVGRQNRRRVVDLFYFRAGESTPVAKLLLLEVDNGFKPLILIIATAGEMDLAPTTIVDHKGTRIISSYCRVWGSGHFVTEDYFLFDEALRIPVRLPVGKVIGEQLRKLLPQGTNIRKGGGFDIATMTFQHSVWNEGDSTGGPTGGRVRIELTLNQFNLVPIFAEYDPHSKLE